MTATAELHATSGIHHQFQPSIRNLVLVVTTFVVVCSVEKYQHASMDKQQSSRWNNERASAYVFPVDNETTTKATYSLRSKAMIELTDSESSTTMTESASSDEETSSFLQAAQQRRALSPPSSAPSAFPFQLKFINGIRYFHCPAKQKKKIDIFLLHSDSFTLRIWRSSGVLQLLCAHPHLATTAVDLDAGSTYTGLQNLLTSMAQQKIIQLPVALVTPSASGWSVVTWMQGDPTTASNYFKIWIPVAPGGVKYATDSQIINLLHPPNHPSKDIAVLAIYGTNDIGGMHLSERLGKLVPATVVGLPGNHSVYRQSPRLFVETITKYLGV
jgi:hypothetical protein